MTNALYIDCCIRGEQSRTKKLAEAFLASYGAREDVSLTRLTLTDEPLILFTNGFFWQREQLLERGELDHPRFRYAHQFQQADRVIIAALPQEEMTKGGIILPDTAKEKPQQGEVVAVGKGRVSDTGETIAMTVKAGDKVLYGKYSGTEVKIDGTEYLIVKESEVLAIIG